MAHPRYLTDMKPTLDPEAVGAVLRAHRLARGLSYESAANRAGVDRTHISLVERGKRKPTIEAVTRLLIVYRVPWHVFGAQLDALLATTPGDLQS